ncbi:MAG: hypothetical protein Q9212_002527 [Teloschistes hypoglaucus]
MHVRKFLNQYNPSATAAPQDNTTNFIGAAAKAEAEKEEAKPPLAFKVDCEPSIIPKQKIKKLTLLNTKHHLKRDQIHFLRNACHSHIPALDGLLQIAMYRKEGEEVFKEMGAWDDEMTNLRYILWDWQDNLKVLYKARRGSK